LVEIVGALLGLEECGGVDGLEELEPAQVGVEVGPVEERGVGVDREVSRTAGGSPLKTRRRRVGERARSMVAVYRRGPYVSR
jgi:hypothetical protein